MNRSSTKIKIPLVRIHNTYNHHCSYDINLIDLIVLLYQNHNLHMYIREDKKCARVPVDPTMQNSQESFPNPKREPTAEIVSPTLL